MWTLCNTYSDILTMMMFSNSTWWCTLYDVIVLLYTLWYDDEHAWFDVMTYFYMCTYYIHTTCWWWWWLLDDDDGTYSMTLMYNLWWCSVITEQRLFSDCGWQWAVCGSDIYRDDLTVIRVQRLPAAEFGMWQVHRFDNLLLIRVPGRGKERRS